VRVFHSIDELRAAAGEHLGYSSWRTVTQREIDLFADATGDRQWIHTDPERAKTGPFGSTVAHGYLTLSLVPQLVWEVYTVEGIGMSLNYGSNRVRYPAALPVGSRIRAGVELLSVEPGAGGFTETMRVTVEREGGGKPVCVAETVSVLYPEREPA
jgi:acyl dehydratase